MRWKKNAMMLIITVLLVYVMIMAAMFVFQRKLLYPANRHILSLAQYNVPNAEEVKLHTPDGLTLQSWYFAPQGNIPTILYLHGNAGHLGDRTLKLTSYNASGFGVFALSYRGYGASEGSPDEQGIYTDARTALDYLTKEKGLMPEQIVLYGESLGSGVAIQMATEHDVAAVVLEAPYTSIERRASELYPWLPVPWLIKDKFYSIRKIDSINAPLLIFHNDGDQVVPQRHGRALFEKAKEPKKAYWLPGSGHVDFEWDELAAHMKLFAEQQGIISPSH